MTKDIREMLIEICCVAVLLCILFSLPKCNGDKNSGLLLTSDTSTVKKKQQAAQPNITVEPEANVVIRWRDRIIYKDKFITDSLFRIDTLLKDLSIIAEADTTVISPMKVGDSVLQDTTRVRGIFRFPDNRMLLIVERKPFTYEYITTTVTNFYKPQKEFTLWDKILYTGTGFAAGMLVDRAVR